jgi:hypothetical protein
LGKPVEIIDKFEKLIFEHEQDNCDFLEQKINKLKISYLVNNQLMRICKDDKYKKMKEFIFKIFLSNNNVKNVKSIIDLIDSLEKSDKDAFFKELMKKCKFKKDEFYSTEENNKINLLCELYKEKKLEKISGEIQTTLDEIIIDIDKGEIERKKIEEFLKNKEEIVKKRLGLIKIRFDGFGPENAHDKLNKTLESITEDIEKLTYIKSALSKFQRERYKNEIRQMIEII